MKSYSNKSGMVQPRVHSLVTGTTKNPSKHSNHVLGSKPACGASSVNFSPTLEVVMSCADDATSSFMLATVCVTPLLFGKWMGAFLLGRTRILLEKHGTSDDATPRSCEDGGRAASYLRPGQSLKPSRL